MVVVCIIVREPQTLLIVVVDGAVFRVGVRKVGGVHDTTTSAFLKRLSLSHQKRASSSSDTLNVFLSVGYQRHSSLSLLLSFLVVVVLFVF